MIAIESDRISIQSSSSSKLALCHICGDDFPKQSLPSHVRSCIRNISLPASRTNSASHSRQGKSIAVRRVSVSDSTFTLVDSNLAKAAEKLALPRSEKRSFSLPGSIEVSRQEKETFEESAEVVDHESVEERVDLSDHLVPCSICSRKFMKTRLDVHYQVCLKSKQKVRKVFNTQASRVSGTEMEKYVKKAAAAPLTGVEAPIIPKKNWRIKHAAFRNMVIAARDPSSVQAPAVNPDYVPCPSCSRNFNSESAKRHIPICKDKAAKKAMERASASNEREREDKLAELRKRTAYKPPKPKTK